jgi:hypothetical protein
MKYLEWKDILPLLGVVIGWLLTRFTMRRTEQLADRRVIKEVLYSLLELNGVLDGLARAHTLLPALVPRLRKQLPVAPPAEFEAAIDEMLTSMLRETLVPVLGQQLASLKEDYAASLLKLAAVDPINAYRLRGQAELLERLPQIMTAWQQTFVAHVGEPTKSQPDLLPVFRQHLEPREISETRKLIQDVMQQLARQLDRNSRRQLAALLVKRGPSEQEIAGLMERQMAELLPVLQAMSVG